MSIVEVKKHAGVFAENKDIAARFREDIVLPTLSKNQEVIVDFQGVEGATQSFVHALISEAIRKYGPDVLDQIIFEHCNETVKRIIMIVTDYMQESE